MAETAKMGDFQSKIFDQQAVLGKWKAEQTLAKQMKVAAQIGRAGHTFPTIVSGLRSPNFGVYNCDQVYRMGNIAQLNPTYKDVNSNESIEDGYVACVMDLSYNGSFSFHPNYLTLNKEGKNAILLFTQDKQIYLIDQEAFSKLDLHTSHTVELPMRNVTSMLKSPSDLKNMLNI